MCNFQTIFFLIFVINLWKINAEVSDKRLCVDEQCSVQIGEGKTLVRYSSPDRRILSFAPNTPVKIYSYGAGSSPNYIGVEINGKRGYINKNHIRETRTFKKPILLLPTEYASSESPGSQIQADAVKQEYEIIDGTKIPIDPGLGSNNPTEEPLETSTESVVVPKQSSDEKTEDLILDLSRKENIIESSQIPKIVVKDPESLDQKLKESEITGSSQEPSNNQKNAAGSQDTNTADIESDKVSGTISIERDINKNPENAKTEKGEEGDVDDDNEDDDDEEEEQEEEKSFFDKILDTVENFAKEELVQEEATKDDVNSDSQKKMEVNDQDIGMPKASAENTISNTPDEQVVHKVENANESQKTADKGPILSDNDAKLSEDTITNSAKSDNLETVSTDVNKVDLGSLQEFVTPKSQIPLKIIEKSSTQLDPPTTAIPVKDYKEQSEKSELKETQLPTTTTASNDYEALPLEDEVTPNPVPNLNVEEFSSAKEKTVGNDNKENEEAQVEDQKPLEELDAKKLVQEEKIEGIKSENQKFMEGSFEEKLTHELKNQGLNSERLNLTEELEENSVAPNSSSFVGGLGLGLFNHPLVNSDGKSASTEDVEDGEKPIEEPKSSANGDIDNENEDLETPIPASKAAVSLEESTTPTRPDLGPNEPIFIDVTPPKDEIKKIVEEDLDDGNVTEDFKISVPDLDIPTQEPPKLQENSDSILSRISSFFGGVSGSEEVKQSNDAGFPSYEEAAKDSDTVKEVVEEPFIKKDAYVTGAEDDIKTLDTQNLAADRAYSSKEAPDFSAEPLENVWSFNQKDKINFCDTEECSKSQPSENTSDLTFELILHSFSSEMFMYLSTTAISITIFLFLYLILDKCKREAPLVARINKLEQELLATKKENQLLQEQDSTLVVEQPETIIQGVPNEVVEELHERLKQTEAMKAALEEQVSALEKELDNSTEVGIELNRIISDMLSSTDGSEILKENVEQMQKRLLEQQDTINSMNENVTLRETENYELRLELEISHKKVMDLQGEVDKMVERLVKMEEERDAQQSALEKEIEIYQVKINDSQEKESVLSSELQELKSKIGEFQRVAELKIKEYNTLKESLNEIKSVKNNKDAIKSLLEVTEIKAQLEQFRSDNSRYLDQLRLEQESNVAYAKKIQALSKELGDLKGNYELADKEKVEAKTKLEVLNNYFKEKEEQMQKEISKYESLWAVKTGEATSTTERIRLLQEELQNYKAQNESLKQEIMNQEVELKSQISVLEKKAHESWMTIRQTERKLEEARQEAAQLRNRLTMKERAALERIQSPLHQNGEMPLSPPPLDVTLSPPPLIGNPRDLTMSPPIPGMPPLPFLPPPPGGLPPFLPPPPGGLPPPGMPPFMPPPIFPGDHRPPPLGRMSSPPPPNSRYSPESTIYSEYDRYDRNSPSPIYDSEYGASPPARAYSPYEERLRDERLRDNRRDYREDRRDYSRSHGRNNGRTSKGISSGSDNELGKINRKPIKKV